MKLIHAAVLLAAVCVPSFAADPVVGDARTNVIRQIGKPRGRMVMGDRETLVYDRGFVELATGHVTKVKLVTPEELTAQLAAREEAARRAEEERAARIAAGEKARDGILSSLAYATNSPVGRLAMWETFHAEHPDVSLPEEYQQAVRSKQESDRQAAEAAAVAAAKEEPRPRLSASKRRRMHRTGGEEAEAGAAP